MALASLKKILNINNSESKKLRKHIYAGDLDFIKDFLNNNYYEINGFDEEYKTLLDHAVLAKKIEIVEFLILNKAKIGTLLYDTQKQDLFMNYLFFLDDAGYDINSYDRLGFSAVHYASSMGFFEAMDLLSDMGADLGNKASDGKTPFEYPIYKEKGQNQLLGVYWGKS
jgi:ankyrin repeat protein